METYTITQFGGLNEVDPVDEVGIDAAQDLSNVTWDRSLGAIQRRSGFDNVTGSAEANALRSLHRVSRTRALATHGTTLEAYDETGTSIATYTLQTSTAGYQEFQTIGTPSATYTYITDPGDKVVRFDGASTFAARPAIPLALHLALSPTDNRLVAAGVNGEASKVAFSDPGDPETFAANNYVTLTPGDGEDIVGAVTWNNQVFVFKPSTLFVFYGTSVDADGNPIFNYRTVSLQGSEATAAPGSGVFPVPQIVSCAEGVFYYGARGIYMTTGDSPIRVSDGLDITLSYLQSQFAGYASRKLFFTDSAAETLVYDLEVGAWTEWTLPATSRVVPPWLPTSGYALFGGSDSGTAHHVFKFSDSYTTDDGTAISAHWTSGLSNLGYESEKRLKYIDVWGTGSVSLSVQSDFAAAANAATLTLGTDPAIARARYTTSAKGTLFGIKLANVSGGDFKVHRITLHFEPTKVGTSDR